MSSNSVVRTGKNTIALLAGTVGKMVASFGFVIYATYAMGLEVFGRFSIALLYFELFLSLSATAVGILLTRDLAKWKRSQNRLITSAMVMALILVLASPLIMIVFASSMNYSPDTVQAIMVAALALLPASLCVVLESVFVSFERAEFVTFGTIVDTLIRVPFSILVLYAGFSWIGVMWVLVGSRVLLLVYYRSQLARITSFRRDFHRKSIIRFMSRWRMFAAENWLATINNNTDLLVLSYVAGETAAGLYAAAYKIVRLGSLVARAYTTAIFPIMSQLHGKAKDSFATLFQQTIRAMAMVALPAVVGISLFTEQTIDFLYADEYAGAEQVLQVLIWILLVEIINPFLSHALFAQNKQNRSMYVAGISMSVNIVLTYLLVFEYGAVGAAAATVGAGAVATISYCCFLMPRRELLSTTIVFARVLVATVGFGAVLYLTQNQPLVGRIVMGLAVYAVLLILIRAVRRQDFVDFKRLVLTRT